LELRKPDSYAIRLLLCIFLFATGSSSLAQVAPRIAATFLPLPFQVNDICTDRKGLLWLATGQGLYIYDGREAIKVPQSGNTAVTRIR